LGISPSDPTLSNGYDPKDHFLKALIVETFANCIDAKAKIIQLSVTSDGTYRISDNGRGMSEDEFEDYHNIASFGTLLVAISSFVVVKWQTKKGKPPAIV